MFRLRFLHFTFAMYKTNQLAKQTSQEDREVIAKNILDFSVVTSFDNLHYIMLLLQSAEQTTKEIADMSMNQTFPPEFASRMDPSSHMHTATDQKKYLLWFKIECHFVQN